MARALFLGMDLFDTAAAYGAGASESALGIALRACGADAHVSTKAVVPLEGLGDVRGAVLRCVEGSLRRLGRSSLTLLFLHNRVAAQRNECWRLGVGPVLSVDDVLGANGVADAFAELRRDGVVRCAGITAYGGEMPAVAKVIESGAIDAVNVSYSVANPSAFLDVACVRWEEHYAGVGALAASEGLGVLGIRVLASGALVQETRADGGPAAAFGLAKDLGEGDPVDGALRFVLTTPGVSSAVIGVSRAAHADAAAAAVRRGSLDAD
ncbi:MAG TPA: aldo/keto reductase, partial [Acidimicrobiales bacterium]|nr:aldo/keto reductase [Acidimicrobiales bacterium]